MAKFETFDRDIRLATESISPEAISAELAKFAQVELAKVIATGQASNNYQRFVNGREGAPETSVIAPGPILYVFANWSLVIRAALAEIEKRSPKRSGRYASGFMVLADGAAVRSYGNIDADAEVVIFNVRPYTRKIEVGAMKMAVPPRHFDRTKQALARQFGSEGRYRFETRFINAPGGLHQDVPYRLRRSQGRRKGRQAGDTLTYPAIVINMVD